MELYIHLPFCRQKCRYCDFPSYAGQEALFSRYVDALLTEAEQQAEALGHPQVETVFIGGGTPSLLPPELLRRLLTRLRELFDIVSDAEFTSEANPGTLTEAWLSEAVHGGVNRLSMGLQAAQPKLLHTLGRIHTAEQAAESVRLARDHGISDINLDLMFGLPGQTLDDWRETLDFALALSPEHLSCYGLILEEGTPMFADAEAGRLTFPDEDTERAMYDLAIRMLKEHGLQQYEISNFAMPGHECRHNLGYWRQVPYLGLGASAASMLPDADGTSFCLRTANPPGLMDYMAMIEENRSSREIIPVAREEARFETMMLALRTTEGISEERFLSLHGVPLMDCYGIYLTRFVQQGLMEHEGSRWFLTRRGMDIQNSLLVEMMEK